MFQFTRPALSNQPAGVSTHRAGGFSLIEVMVSVVVLICIVLLAGSMVTGVSRSTIQAGKQMDADNQARQIFSRMASDFAAIYNRGDVSYYFNSKGGNDEFYFYSQAPGHPANGSSSSDDSSLSGSSLVGYRVSQAGNDRIELERLAAGLHWMDVGGNTSSSGRASSLLFLPVLVKDAFAQIIADPSNNSSNAASSASSQWDVVGDQVFRMEFCFLLKDGTFSSMPVTNNAGTTNNLDAGAAPGVGDDSTKGYSSGSRWYDKVGQVAYQCKVATQGAAEWKPIGLGDVNAVGVTLALLAPRSRALTEVSAVKSAAASLSDFSAAPVANDWQSRAASLSSPLSSMRVYERFFYLN